MNLQLAAAVLAAAAAAADLKLQHLVNHHWPLVLEEPVRLHWEL